MYENLTNIQIILKVRNNLKLNKQDGTGYFSQARF